MSKALLPLYALESSVMSRTEMAPMLSSVGARFLRRSNGKTIGLNASAMTTTKRVNIDLKGMIVA
jgi:hypothetical protein